MTLRRLLLWCVGWWLTVAPLHAETYSFSIPPDYCEAHDGTAGGEAAPSNVSFGSYDFPGKGFIRPTHADALASGYLLCPIVYPYGLGNGAHTIYVDLIWNTSVLDAAQFVRWQTDLVFTNWGGKSGEYVKSEDATVVGGRWENATTAAQPPNSGPAGGDILSRTGQQPFIFGYNGGNTPPSEGTLCAGTTCGGKHGVLRIQRISNPNDVNAVANLMYITVWVP